MHVHEFDNVTLSKDELKKLINGKFKTFKCINCEGRGWYWVDDMGTMRCPGKDDSVDSFYRHPCKDLYDGDCGGVGFRVVFEE